MKFKSFQRLYSYLFYFWSFLMEKFGKPWYNIIKHDPIVTRTNSHVKYSTLLYQKVGYPCHNVYKLYFITFRLKWVFSVSFF